MKENTCKLIKNVYENFEQYLAVIMMAVMVSCLTLQILARLFFGTSIAWTEELSRFTFIWTIYIGMALAAKENTHVRITAQFLKCSLQTRLKFRIFADIVWVVSSLYLSIKCGLIVRESHYFPEISPTIGIVKTWVEMIIPLCFLLIAVRVVQEYYKHYKNNTLLTLVKTVEDI